MIMLNFQKMQKENQSLYTNLPRPAMKIDKTATGPSEITNFELLIWDTVVMTVVELLLIVGKIVY